MKSVSSLAHSWNISPEAQKSVVREIYIQRKREWDVANHLDKMLEEDLWISGVSTDIHIRYLVDNLTDEEYEVALPTIFSELPVEDLVTSEDFLSTLGDKKVLNIESVPWQYDQTIDAVQACLMLQTGRQWHQVRTSATIRFAWRISDADMEKVRKYLVNPVEKQDTPLSDKHLVRDIPLPEDIESIHHFSDLDSEGLHYLLKRFSLAMNIEDLKFAQAYFQKEWRDPTVSEIKVLDTYRSDHCRHTTFNTHITSIACDPLTVWEDSLLHEIIAAQKQYGHIRNTLGRDKKPNTLMELATIATKWLKHTAGPDSNVHNLVESEENNACTFRTTIDREDGGSEEREIMFKNETHNHPTEIEPFWWAATCLGWCIRDPLSWRSRVFQAMRVTGSSNPTEPISETLAGKLSQKTISQLAALWYSSYGNQMGIPAGEVREYFHPWYVAKRFEVGYVIAWAPAHNIVREKPKRGDKVILIWWKTWRDGIGGATWSSKEHDSKSVLNLWAEVQKGNPVEERKIARLYLDPNFTKLVKKCNDFWAGWVSVAIGELARGLTIDLDTIPVKYKWLNGTELAISESQERMVIVVAPENYEAVMPLIDTYNLEWTHVAQVTDHPDDPSQDALIMQWQGKQIVHLEREFLDIAGAPRAIDMLHISEETERNLDPIWTIYTEKCRESSRFEDIFNSYLSELCVASQQWLWSQFDNSVGASNVLAMYGGKYQCTPQLGMVSKIPTSDWIDATTVTISTHGFNPTVASHSAYLGAINAVKLAVSKQVALWWNYQTIWLSLQEYFWKLKDDPKKWGTCYSALLGAFKAQIELWIAAIWWKDSMSWTFKTAWGEEINVPPSLVAFAANTGTIDNIISSELKGAWNAIVYFPASDDRNVYKMMLEEVQQLIRLWVVRASHVVELGWVPIALAKMAFGNRIWVVINNTINEKNYFGAALGWIVLEIDQPAHRQDFSFGSVIWQTNETKDFTFEGTIISLDNIKKKRQWTFENTFPTSWWGWKVEKIVSSQQATTRNVIAKDLLINLSTKKPTVLIPVFPGTNSELDTAHAIRKAGMNVQEFIFNTQTPEKLLASTEAFAQLLKTPQMLVIPWGFSAWDQPHGSAKFIATIFRMQIVRDAMQRFLENPGTLTLGICNGFQALIKLGVFDESKITDYLNEESPTLTHNTTARHMTNQVWLQITSILSPLLSKVHIGDTFIIPISHGEGRIFMKDKEKLQKYIENGQVVFQYLDEEGCPTNKYNGSLEGIAWLCSPDGRILWLMPHPERSDLLLFQNIPWNHDLPIFEWAANAFGVHQFKAK